VQLPLKIRILNRNMSKPIYHAISSAKKYGGTPEEYIDIHDFMDSSKGALPDNRHRALTHNSWFISNVIEKVFGFSRTNSAGRIYSTRQIAEDHVLEDYNMRYIPTAQDFLGNISWQEWMDNGKKGYPPSHEKIVENHIRSARQYIPFKNID
jgi:hypothetical protein